jgi:hypothetical protein
MFGHNTRSCNLLPEPGYMSYAVYLSPYLRNNMGVIDNLILPSLMM